MKPEPVAFRVGERLFSSMLAAGLYASEMRLTVEPLYLEEPKYQVSSQGLAPCTERMPNDNAPVIAWDGLYQRFQFTAYGCWQFWNSERITHWHPLPSPPTMKK